MKQDQTLLYLVDKMERAALKAAKHLVASRSQMDSIKVQVKSDSSLVMNLDLECEQLILDALADTIPLVSEESESSHGLIAQNGDYLIIDPIDGTASCKRYLNKLGGDIGFGPLLGCVLNGKLKAAVYYDLPSQILYSASDGYGSYLIKDFDLNIKELPAYSKRNRLEVKVGRSLEESGLLFFPGSQEEVQFVLYARENNLVENTYRLGGFANDSTRIARDIEQIQLQNRVKAWDFSAVKIAQCAGLSVIVDPYGKAIQLADWNVSMLNPTLVCHPRNSAKLVEHIKRSIEV